MANSSAKLIEVSLSTVGFFILEILYSFFYLIILMLILEHFFINLQIVNSLILYYLIWLVLRYFSDFLSDYSLCFLVFSFDAIYYASSGLYACSVLFYFYLLQPYLQNNLQKQSFEFIFMHFYVLLSGVLVNAVLNVIVSINRYLLIMLSA